MQPVSFQLILFYSNNIFFFCDSQAAIINQNISIKNRIFESGFESLYLVKTNTQKLTAVFETVGKVFMIKLSLQDTKAIFELDLMLINHERFFSPVKHVKKCCD